MAQIRQTGGKPTLYIDGKITAPVLYALSDFPGAASNTAYAQKNIAAFARAGVNLVAADTGLHIGWRKTTGFLRPAGTSAGKALACFRQSRVLHISYGKLTFRIEFGSHRKT